jgi:hypothetical protein
MLSGTSESRVLEYPECTSVLNKYCGDEFQGAAGIESVRYVSWSISADLLAA